MGIIKHDILAGETQRLESCVTEKLEFVGTIQPGGVLVSVDPESLIIQHVSRNSHDVFGRSAESLVGTPLNQLLAIVDGERLHEVIARPQAPIGRFRLSVNARTFDAAVHTSGRLAIIEFEPTTPSPDDAPDARLYDVIQKLQRLQSLDELRQMSVREVRALTGFDRVMLYHFHPDGHGEIVAEDRHADMEPYLGLHYPASDIPPQARALYIKKLSRSIADSSYEPVEIVTAASATGDLPLDLSLADLRSISPHHLQFMKNMGQASTLALSLVYDDRLIGMITCAHRTRRTVSAPLRHALEVLASQIALHTSGLNEIARLRRLIDVTSIRIALQERVSEQENSFDSLLEGELTLLDLVAADGVLVAHAGRRSALGRELSEAQMDALGTWVAANQQRLPAVTAALGEFDPELSQQLPGVAGLVVVPLETGSGFIAWHRSEMLSQVQWLGDQSAANRLTPLSPRNSFSAWSQAVVGTADPWNEVDVGEAIGLSRDFNRILLHQAEAQLAYFELHDQLTGLPNRTLLERRLRETLEPESAIEPVTVSVLFVGVDHFAVVNDSLGHHVGDALLQETARRISNIVSEHDLVGRFGGDVFVVVSHLSVDRSRELAEKLVTAFQHPIEFHGTRLHSTVSVGIASSVSGDSVADLLRQADVAMYHSKEQGRNRVTPFETGLSAKASARFEIAQALRLSVDNEELVANYQTVSRISDRAVVGVEALLRWNRPGIGLVPPDDFIPLAEATGLIIPVGRWIIAEAIRQLGEWKTDGIVTEDFTMAINISPVQLTDPGLITALDDACSAAHVLSADITLEITESLLVSEGSATHDTLNAIAAAGYLLSIDDFGTGHSSLSYLRYLPTSQLKIDRSFVAGMLTNPNDAALVSAVIGLAHDFGMTCVAEGVETPEQLESLSRLGCDLAQGYLLGRPLPAEKRTALGGGLSTGFARTSLA